MPSADFIQTYGPLANDIATATGLDPSVVLGVIDVETGNGAHVSGNNIFGISPGGKVAAYPDVPTAAQDFVRLIRSRYSAVPNAGGPEQQAMALVRGGYNTVNPNYAGLVSRSAASVRQQLGMDQQQQAAYVPPDYNIEPRPSAPAAPPAQSEKDKAVGSLPPEQPAQGQSEKDKALASLPPPPVEKPPSDPYHEMSDATAALDKSAAAAVEPAKGVASRIAGAAVQGYQDMPNILTPGAQAALEDAGPVGRYVSSPLIRLGNQALGAVGAVGGALGQGAYEFGNALLGPSGGRDLYMLAQVAPFAGMGAGVPRMPNALDTGGPKFVSERFAPPAVEGATTGDRILQLLRHDDAETAGTSPSLLDSSALVQPPPRPTVGEAVPRSVGAAASRDMSVGDLPEQRRGQVLRDLQTSVNQTAEDRAGPRMQDDTQYVKGIPPRLLAGRDFSTPTNALDEKVAVADDPAFRAAVDANKRDRNTGMVDLLRNDAQDDIALEKAHEARSAVSPGEMGVFNGEKPVDASDLLAAVDKQMAGGSGKRSAVRSVLSEVRNSLFDADGNLEVLPSQLYGARQNLTDLLKKGVKGVGDQADNVRAAKAILEDLLPTFDKTITQGAPRFTEYLKAFRQASLPIDQMEFLQRYQTGAKKITDVNGYLQPNKVQKMLDDIYQSVKAPGVNKAKSLTQEQIQNVINVRNELAAQALQDRMAAVRGSDTFQQFNRSSTGMGHALRMGGKAMLETGLLATTGGMGNLLYHQVIKPGMDARAAAKIAARVAARKNALLSHSPLNPP